MGFLQKATIKATESAWVDFISLPTLKDAESFSEVKIPQYMFYAVSSYEIALNEDYKNALSLLKRRNKIFKLGPVDVNSIAKAFSFEKIEKETEFFEKLSSHDKEKWIELSEDINNVLKDIENDTIKEAFIVFIHYAKNKKVLDTKAVNHIMWKLFNQVDESFKEGISSQLHSFMISYFVSNPEEQYDSFNNYLVLKAATNKMDIAEYVNLETSKTVLNYKEKQPWDS